MKTVLYVSRGDTIRVAGIVFRVIDLEHHDDAGWWGTVVTVECDSGRLAIVLASWRDVVEILDH